MIFELQGKLIIDENKPTIVFIDKGDLEQHTHIFGAARVIRDQIKNDYNIITIGTGCKLTNNYYEIKRNFNKDLIRKEQNPEKYLELNYNTINDQLLEDFKYLPKIDYIVIGIDDFFRLPLGRHCLRTFDDTLYNMKNEFFDYVGTDKEIISKIDELNTNLVNTWDSKISPMAFSIVDISIFTRLIDFINRTNRLKEHVIAFAIDPAIYKPFFDKLNIKNKFFYFADDKRGTRDFNKLDIAQLQHIVYENQFQKDNLDDWDKPTIEKTHNMFFAGTLFQEKGHRKFIFDEFLNDVKSKNCSYYVPLRKNGINKKMNKLAKRHEEILKGIDEFNDLYNTVINHNNYKGSLLPTEMNERIKRYKYGMIFRCVSINDSLNFRPVLYTYNNILPLLDYQYDPTYLQIPKEIQDVLVVKTAKDIDEKIEYFNNNDDERIKILEELKKHFSINEYLNDPDMMIKKQIQKIFK